MKGKGEGGLRGEGAGRKILGKTVLRVVVVPLTSNTGRQYPGEAFVTLSGKPCKAMADQIMAADKSRLKNPMGSLSKSDMAAVESAILIHLGMPG